MYHYIELLESFLRKNNLNDKDLMCIVDDFEKFINLFMDSFVYRKFVKEQNTLVTEINSLKITDITKSLANELIALVFQNKDCLSIIKILYGVSLFLKSKKSSATIYLYNSNNQTIVNNIKNYCRETVNLNEDVEISIVNDKRVIMSKLFTFVYMGQYYTFSISDFIIKLIKKYYNKPIWKVVEKI